MTTLLLVGLGGSELALVAALVLLLVGVHRLMAMEGAPATAGRDADADASSRAYLDRLVGAARPAG